MTTSVRPTYFRPFILTPVWDLICLVISYLHRFCLSVLTHHSISPVLSHHSNSSSPTHPAGFPTAALPGRPLGGGGGETPSSRRLPPTHRQTPTHHNIRVICISSQSGHRRTTRGATWLYIIAARRTRLADIPRAPLTSGDVRLRPVTSARSGERPGIPRPPTSRRRARKLTPAESHAEPASPQSR